MSGAALAPSVASPGSEPKVHLELRGPVAVLTLDHPPVNVLSRSMLEILDARLREADDNPAVRSIVLASAAPRAFAAGADIREMAPLDPPEADAHARRGQGVANRIESVSVPVVAAVHGVCLGGGCEIVLACDVVVASDDAIFGQPEIQLGVMPGWGGTQRLPLRVGAGNARWWILSGEPVTAVAARAQGLVAEVVSKDLLLPTAMARAQTLAEKPAGAIAAAKRSLHRAFAPTLADGLAVERGLWAGLFGTVDQREGMRAFLEKRPPSFARRAPPLARDPAPSEKT